MHDEHAGYVPVASCLETGFLHVRRSLFAVVLAAVLAAGCVGPTLDSHEYREAAVDSLDRARGRLDAARLAADTAGRGQAPAPLVATTMGELEHATTYAQEAFATRQPPPGSDAVRKDTLPLLHEASSLLAEVRIAAFRGDLTAVGARTDELDELARRLEQRARELRP